MGKSGGKRKIKTPDTNPCPASEYNNRIIYEEDDNIHATNPCDEIFPPAPQDEDEDIIGDEFENKDIIDSLQGYPCAQNILRLLPNVSYRVTKLLHIYSLIFVCTFCVTKTVFSQSQGRDSLLRITIEKNVEKVTNSDYQLGSGVGYIIFNIKKNRIKVLEINCSNSELYKRLQSLNGKVLNNMRKINSKAIYYVCVSYLSEDSKNGKVFWNNNLSYEGLHNFQWGRFWKNVTILKPVTIYTNNGHE
ncbi:MAG: hypothetical protein E6Q95_02590 [Chitinophagaceae bacterium]|nr:MAG: hypothetical protein E6Q95_02590 [Chitinophagaceae bacterium]